MIVDYNYWYFDQAMPVNICEDIIRVGKERKPDVNKGSMSEAQATSKVPILVDTSLKID